MTENPFSLDFGAKPTLFIPRYVEMSKIIKTFSAEKPSTHIFMIMGARGNGKTVLMSAVTEKILENDKWVHVDLSPEGDMMNNLASSLYQRGKKKLSKLKFNINLDLKIASIGASSEIDKKYSSTYTDIDSMLEQLKKRDMRVLITVDEAVNSKTVREFTTYFQHCIREEYPVFLLMTGLYKNIRALQNNKTQTFLKRAPKLVIETLNKGRIAEKYKEVFSISDEEAMRIANHTNGYSYAFQILGYLLFDNKKQEVTPLILKEYRLILGESSYDKIWEELSENEKLVAWTAADYPEDTSVKVLREKLQMSSNEFSTYQNTLEKSGVFAGNSAYGRIRFALPYIGEYIKMQM